MAVSFPPKFRPSRSFAEQIVRLERRFLPLPSLTLPVHLLPLHRALILPLSDLGLGLGPLELRDALGQRLYFILRLLLGG